MDKTLWDQTVSVATGQIKELKGVEIPADSYRSDFAENAVKALQEEGLDTTGESWEKATVELSEGGA